MREMFLMIDILSYLRHSDGFIILFCRRSVLRISHLPIVFRPYGTNKKNSTANLQYYNL